MANVRDLLKVKGDQVWNVTPDTSVLVALKLMAEKEVGALLVLQNSQIVGIFSERDFARSVAKIGQCASDLDVDSYMTKDVFTVTPDQSIEDCMTLMTQRRFRHLPVLEGTKLVGMISIGDVVKEVIASKESTINTLENYIEGRGYGQ
jgi:CBS domain-containing protein